MPSDERVSIEWVPPTQEELEEFFEDEPVVFQDDEGPHNNPVQESLDLRG